MNYAACYPKHQSQKIIWTSQKLSLVPQYKNDKTAVLRNAYSSLRGLFSCDLHRSSFVSRAATSSKFNGSTFFTSCRTANNDKHQQSTEMISISPILISYGHSDPKVSVILIYRHTLMQRSLVYWEWHILTSPAKRDRSWTHQQLLKRRNEVSHC